LRKKRKRKMMIIKRKKDIIKSEREAIIEIKSEKIANMMDSRKKMKETDEILSFNVLLQKNL
jgi:hypothetical protein